MNVETDLHSTSDNKVEKLLAALKETYGDRLADPEHFPSLAKFQWELFIKTAPAELIAK